MSESRWGHQAGATAGRGAISTRAKNWGGEETAPVQRQSLYIGDVVASAAPVHLQTLLGSCVAVCLHDPVAKAGGMNHILLPSASGRDRTARFGVNAMELLINQVMHCGGDRRRFVAKAFGAGNVLRGLQSPTVGELNAKFVREFLATERIPLVGERLGGTQAVQVHFFTATGKAVVRSVDGSRLPAILKAEDVYNSSHFAERDFTGDVTLF